MLSPRKINRSGLCFTTRSNIGKAWSSLPQEPKAILEMVFCEYPLSERETVRIINSFKNRAAWAVFFDLSILCFDFISLVLKGLPGRLVRDLQFFSFLSGAWNPNLTNNKAKKFE